MLFSGISADAAKSGNPHIITSTDGKFSLWAGVIDDLWKLGKPVGTGSPWFNAQVGAGEVSDPYLLTGYDKKSIKAISKADTKLDIEVDIDGTGLWVKYGTLELKAGEKLEKDFNDDLQGYWVRFRTSTPTTLTTTLIYR